MGTDEWLVVTQIQSVKSSNSSDTTDFYMFFAHFSPPAFCPCLYNTGKSIINIYFCFPERRASICERRFNGESIRYDFLKALLLLLRQLVLQQYRIL